MNKPAFNARARVGRALASIARRNRDGWAYEQAKEYARSGFVGPDLGRYLDWYLREGEFPSDVSLGALRRADELFCFPADMMDQYRRAILDFMKG